MKEVFECRECGWCCRGEGGIYLPDDKVAAAAALLDMEAERFTTLYCRPKYGQWEIRTDETGRCVFQDHDSGRCGIHAAKPPMCRDWPFFYGPLNHREGFETAKSNCPGINPEAEFEEFQDWHRVHIGRQPPRTYIYDSKKEPKDES